MLQALPDIGDILLQESSASISRTLACTDKVGRHVGYHPERQRQRPTLRSLPYVILKKKKSKKRKGKKNPPQKTRVRQRDTFPYCALWLNWNGAPLGLLGVSSGPLHSPLLTKDTFMAPWLGCRGRYFGSLRAPRFSTWPIESTKAIQSEVEFRDPW